MHGYGPARIPGQVDTLTLAVEGISSGDGECWCLEVDEATYRRVRGDEDADQELKVHAGIREDHEYILGEDSFDPMVWRLYPDDLIGRENTRKRVRIEIKVTPL